MSTASTLEPTVRLAFFTTQHASELAASLLRHTPQQKTRQQTGRQHRAAGQVVTAVCDHSPLDSATDGGGDLILF